MVGRNTTHMFNLGNTNKQNYLVPVTADQVATPYKRKSVDINDKPIDFSNILTNQVQKTA